MLTDIWKAQGWQPHSLQREVLLSPVRQRLVAAGRRAGKSEVGGQTLVPEAFRAMGELELLTSLGKRREYWIVGPEYSDAEKEFRVVWNALDRLGFAFDKPGSYNNPYSGDMRISLFGGRYIISAKSAKYPGTLVGEGLSGVVFSEAAKLKPSIYHKFIRPTLADYRGWSFFGSTPEGRNWFYELWQSGQDPDKPGWASWRAPSWSNPYVYSEGVDTEALAILGELRRSGQSQLASVADVWKAARSVIDPEILSLFDDMSQEMFNQEIASLFTEYVGRVFKDFDEEYHVTSQELMSDWATYAAVDYGFTNPTVWLLVQVDPHGERVHVVDEYYERGKTIEEVAREVPARGLTPGGLICFYPDPASPGDTRALSSLLRVPYRSPGSLTIADRIEWFRKKLKFYPEHLEMGHPDRMPWLTIHRRCTNMIREMNLYKYPELSERTKDNNNPPENPVKKDDHTIEALGRLFSGLFGSPWKGIAGARQTKAVVGSRKRRGR